MLNEIRWNESKCLLSAPKEDLGVVKHDTSKNTCEFCGKSHKLTFDLLECYSYHFADDLKDMMQDEALKSLSKHAKSCPICQDEFTTEQKMHIHLGTVHQLVNDILVSEGIMPILSEPGGLDIYLDGVDSLQADLADTSINGDEHYDIDEDECDAYRFDDIEGELQVIEDLSEFSIVNQLIKDKDEEHNTIKRNIEGKYHNFSDETMDKVDNDTIIEIVTNVKFATATESKENIDITKNDSDLKEEIALD